jgi:RNA polymerase sigma factor (TIGR02999 family)
MSSITGVAEQSNNIATDMLFSTLYADLHQLAKRQMARGWTPASMGATTLLHEAYLDMAGRSEPSFPDRARFMGYAARVMRGLIIDRARHDLAVKRGAEFEIMSLEIDMVGEPANAKELSLISDILDRLEKVEPDLAEVVDLKFFCGFSFAEIAAMQNLSERTVQRKWEKARIYLHRSVRPCSSL